MIFSVKKFAYIVDFSYLCSEIGNCTLFLYISQGVNIFSDSIGVRAHSQFSVNLLSLLLFCLDV